MTKTNKCRLMESEGLTQDKIKKILEKIVITDLYKKSTLNGERQEEICCSNFCKIEY